VAVFVLLHMSTRLPSPSTPNGSPAKRPTRGAQRRSGSALGRLFGRENPPGAAPDARGEARCAWLRVLLWVLPLWAAACGGGSAEIPTDHGLLTPSSELRLVWSDEFDGTEGAPVDATKWSAQVGGTGWGQNVLDYKTNCTNPLAPHYTTDNAEMDGQGNLVISALREAVPYDACWYGPCEFSSALLVTASTFRQQYGRFEVRMKTPPGPGLWGSFWLFGINDDGLWGEIDVAELIGRDPAAIYQAAHGTGFMADKFSLRTEVASGIVADEFHVYAADWSPGAVRFSIDGNPKLTITPDFLPSEGTWPYDSMPFYMVLDLGVGGSMSWSGSHDAQTPFPAQLLVDYVRVYELD